MTSDDNVLRTIARSLRDVAGRGLGNFFGFLLALMGISAVGAGIRWVAEMLDGYPIVALVFIAVCAVIWLGALSLVTPASVRGPDGTIHGGFIVGLAAAAGMVWIYIFALFSYLMLRLGAIEFVITAHPDAPLSDLLDAYAWYFLDLVPLLHINDALGWKTDVDLSGGWRGVLLLLFRVVIVFQVFALTKRLLKANDDGHGGTSLRTVAA